MPIGRLSLDSNRTTAIWVQSHVINKRALRLHMHEQQTGHRRARRARGRRGRENHCVTLADSTWRRLDERGAISGESRSREIDKAVEEADGNLGKVRHAVANAMQLVPFRLEEIKAATMHPAVIEAVKDIERSMAAVRAELVKPVVAAKVGTN